MKGYKIYVLQSRSIVISRDVVFHEHIFPFHAIHSDLSIVDPFPHVSFPKPISDFAGYSNDQYLRMARTDLNAHLNPVIPVEHVAPANHVAPIEHVAPANHVAPVQPVAPVEPVAPTVHDASVEHDTSVEPSAPAPVARAIHAVHASHVNRETRAHHNSDLVAHGSNNGSSDTDVVSTAPPPALHQVSNPPLQRRSSRISQPPSYLQKYYCNNLTASSSTNLPTYPIEDYLSTTKLSSDYNHCIANISSTCEPAFYHQAAKIP
ncbi:hypothetical protein HRI_003518100 [Hibiscus trionum]|uniref:Retroviral polymerase SH3-like domain-containing protein n=1 Tax=Hibiscus trionum TaxID=183268 RepID=A0A9W7INJ6_HIBTR|nr:hypothetical protein HRI_003518100 [Hibiscus trionum]